MVVVNLRCTAAGLAGGIPRYVTEVVGRLDGIRTVAPDSTIASGPVGHLWEQTVLPARLGRGETLWSPANFGPFVVRSQVLSIYDLSPIDHPEWFGDRYVQVFRNVVPRLAPRVRRVVTISPFSRERIIERLGVDPDRVVVAGPGVSDVFCPDPTVGRGDDLLVISGPDPRKNLGRILAAWERVASRRPRSRLVVVSGARAKGVFAPTIDRLPERVDVVSDVSDAELADLYRRAAMVISVPLYEGFGLPAAEALGCCSPLVLSDIPAHQHARTHAAALVDPTDVDAIADAMASDLVAPSLVGWQRPDWADTAAIVDDALHR